MPSQASLAPGLVAGSLSSQSPSSVAWSAGSVQASWAPAVVPKPSPSASGYQVVRPSSSVAPSQSLSSPSQTSTAAGLTAEAPSSQSPPCEEKPVGREQPSIVPLSAPKPSPSVSG